MMEHRPRQNDDQGDGLVSDGMAILLKLFN